jgi:hypothetical protein
MYIKAAIGIKANNGLAVATTVNIMMVKNMR